MNLLSAIAVSFGTSISALLLLSKKKDEEYPKKQIADKQCLKSFSDYFYSTNGILENCRINNLGKDRFFVKTKPRQIQILFNCSYDSYACEIGVLCKILSAETLISDKGKISMFTRLCIAESIKNRKKSQFGFYTNYNTFNSVIKHTGYATYSDYFKNFTSKMQNSYTKKRIIEEVIPIAIFTYFNDTSYTNNATGFFTPVKLSSDKLKKFYTPEKTIIKIKGIDNEKEFTFWKYKNDNTF